MTTFVNTVTPFLRVLLPSGDYIQFRAGLLELDKDETGYESVLAEASRNPNISIIVNATTCAQCGQVFDGKAAKAQLGAHRKQNHFDLWLADKEAADAISTTTEIKSRSGYSCDVCAPIQTFGTEDDLAAHVRLLHTDPPAMDDAGNTVGGDGDGPNRKPDVAEGAPAAKRK